MSRKLLSLTVRGKNSTWAFNVVADPQYLDEWRADGLEIYEVCNVIPAWLPAWSVRSWCFLQDLFNFKNPWSER
jgi:hypothetical protein